MVVIKVNEELAVAGVLREAGDPLAGRTTHPYEKKNKVFTMFFLSSKII